MEDAVAEVATAFEIVDMRTPADLTTEERTLMSVAVNILNSGVVLGDPVTNWRDLDLVGCKGVMSINHEQVGEGYGRDVMGHPFEPLVWLANELSRRNHPLKAGDTVITGQPDPADGAGLCVRGSHLHRGPGRGGGGLRLGLDSPLIWG